MSSQNIIISRNKYDIIYADPPWSFSNAKTGGSLSSGSSDQYDVMSMQDLKSLPVAEISKDNSSLFMWWVASMPQEAIDLVNSWGFTLKTMTAFSWIKKTKNWKDHFGMGFYTRQQQEHCLIAIRGKPKVESHSVRQNIRCVNVRHSRKPNKIRREILNLYGEKTTRIELFAREKVDGWDSWGNEL